MASIGVGSGVREVLSAFGSNHDPKYFAAQATYEVPALGQTFEGRDAIGGMLHLFYGGAFADGAAEVGNTIADEQLGLGAMEFTFRGTHTGELMGIAATQRRVEVPMLAIYEIGDGEIRRARLYYDQATLARQLGLS